MSHLAPLRTSARDIQASPKSHEVLQCHGQMYQLAPLRTIARDISARGAADAILMGSSLYNANL